MSLLEIGKSCFEIPLYGLQSSAMTRSEQNRMSIINLSYKYDSRSINKQRKVYSKFRS